VKHASLAFVNHARVPSWNLSVLSDEDKITEVLKETMRAFDRAGTRITRLGFTPYVNVYIL